MIRTDRLQQQLDALDLNPFAAARRAGLEPGYVRDILRGKVKEPGAEKLAKLAQVLGCSPAYLMGFDDMPGVQEAPVPFSGATAMVELPVRHVVAAGTWLKADEVRDEPLGTAPAALVPQYAAFGQWLERVQGDSMNRLLPDGALVHVVDAIEIHYQPQHDDIVVVERRQAQGAFVERSLKQVSLGPAGAELWPRSFNPRWNQPLSLTAGAEGAEDLEVQIVGLVIRAYMTFK